MTREVVVVGGGISGLAAAYYLRAPGVRVTVLEKSPTVGGVLRASEVAGLPVDEGAESLLNRRPEAVDLARAVGLGDDLVYPAAAGPGIWNGGVLRPLPAGTVMGVPSDPAELAGLLDADEVDRMYADRAMPGLPLHGDVSIGALVAERLGESVVDNLVDPLLGGVYAGHARELSLEATVPALAAALREENSLLAAAASVRAGAAGDEAGPAFAGIRGGVGRLAAAVAAASGAEIRTGVTVRGLSPAEPATGHRWRLETGPAPHPEVHHADAVVVAVPAAPAARLLAEAAPAAARGLADVEQASVGIVTLVLPGSAFPERPHLSGFLVPAVVDRAIKAVTFSSVKWPWLADLAGDLVVLRASVGRHRQISELQRSDDELVAVVMAELTDALGVQGSPVAARVTRWGGALPQYAVGHRARMANVRAAVEAVPGLAVCGATYDGVGVAACIALATEAATSVLAELSAVPLSRS